MFKRGILAVFCLCSLAVAASASAQQAATVVMRSGERIGGVLADYGAGGFSMRISGRDREIPASDVASVEFSGHQLTADQTAKIGAGQPFVVLNDGQVIDGRLFDIGGTTPLKITIDTPSGSRDVSSRDVAGIYLRGVTGNAEVARNVVQATAAPPVGALVVPGNQQWTPTFFKVKRGEWLRFQTTGEIRFTGDPNDLAGAAGSLALKKVAGSPLPLAFAGALIGRIDNGAPFGIGDQASMQGPANGMLYLGINDDNVSDNSGQFQVVISR